jgi:hypothetical protein
MRLWLPWLFIILSSVCFAQNTNTNIDLTRIPQEKIRNLLECQFKESGYMQYSALQPAYRKGQSLEGYYHYNFGTVIFIFIFTGLPSMNFTGI